MLSMYPLMVTNTPSQGHVARVGKSRFVLIQLSRSPATGDCDDGASGLFPPVRGAGPR